MVFSLSRKANGTQEAEGKLAALNEDRPEASSGPIQLAGDVF